MKRPTRLIPLALSPRDTARFLGVDAKLIYQALHNGELIAYKIGVKHRILTVDTLDWVRRTFPRKKFPAVRGTDVDTLFTEAGAFRAPTALDYLVKTG